MTYITMGTVSRALMMMLLIGMYSGVTGHRITPKASLLTRFLFILSFSLFSRFSIGYRCYITHLQIYCLFYLCKIIHALIEITSYKDKQNIFTDTFMTILCSSGVTISSGFANCKNTVKYFVGRAVLKQIRAFFFVKKLPIFKVSLAQMDFE